MTNNTNYVRPNTTAIKNFTEEQKVNNWLVLFDKFDISEDGTIVCKASEQALMTLETQSLPVCLLWESAFDSMLIGEDGCMGNFDMYTPIYLERFETMYLVPHSTSYEFAEGKEVTLYPMTEVTKEEFDEFIEWSINH